MSDMGKFGERQAIAKNRAGREHFHPLAEE